MGVAQTHSIRPLNMIRGLAALMVVVSHLSGMGYLPKGIMSGQHGVLIFFVLSGFLMEYLYGKTDMARASVVSDFMVRRFFRIVPLVFFVVILSLVVNWAVKTDFFYRFSLSEAWSALFLISDYSVFWTITVETKFYLFVPFVFFFLAGCEDKTRLIFYALFVVLISYSVGYSVDNKTNWLMYLPSFAGGLLAGHIYRMFFFRLSPKYSTLLFFLSSIILIATIPGVSRLVWREAFLVWDYQLLMVIIVACFILSSTRLIVAVDWLLANKLGDFMGAVSYSVYLIHFVIIWYVDRVLKIPREESLLAVIGILLAIYIVSSVTYLLFERPFIRLGKLGLSRP